MLIALITLAGIKWGAHIAGWLSAFPVVGGPILLLIALEQGVDFASVAAIGMFSAISANLIFALSYAYLGLRYAWYITWLMAIVMYAIVLFSLDYLSLGLLSSCVINGIMLLLMPRFFPRPSIQYQPTQLSLLEVVLRMIMGVTLVLVVTYFAHQLGSRISGMLAMFPVMATVLAVFSHHQYGGVYTVELLRGALMGWYAFSAFSLCVALLLSELGIAMAFVTALVLAFTVQALTLARVKTMMSETT